VAPPGFGNSSIRNSARTVTGVDQTRPTLGPVTPSQILTGTYFTATGGKYQAIVSKSYAVSHSLKVGDTTALFKKTFTIVGISSAPLGSTASDLYVELHTLQTLSGYTGKINGINVRAADSGAVTAVSTEIKKAVPGASVTTAADIASRIEGSLSDTRSLASKLGLALEILGLGAAVMIACVLTLASVSKRVREIGTLKAIGWSQWAVVRQISGESVVAGLLGGVIGVLAGLAAVVAINAAGWTLKASVASPSGSGGGFGFGRASSVPKAGSELVTITTHANWELIALAVALAVIGGLIAGAAGGLRAARLRPAAALRTVE
jgi:putative ABC transport system permease protein